MPFPLLLPLLVKGAVVAAKVVATKGAGATVAKGTLLAVKTYGAQATLATAATGLVGIGALAWTVERVMMAKRAVAFYDKGQYLEAGNELTRIVRSIHMSETGDFAEMGRHWLESGAPLEGAEFRKLISDVRQVTDEAATTKRDITDKMT